MQHKRLILIGSVIFVSIVTWWSSYGWLSAEGKFADWHRYLLPLIFVIVYAAVAGLALALLDSRWDRIAVITSSWASFVIFFPPSVWYLSALPLFFLFWMDASRRSHQERTERSKIRTRSMVGAGTRFLLLGIFLMISLGFYSVRTDGSLTLTVISEGVQRQVDSAYETDFVQGRLADVPPSLQSQFRQDVANYVETFVDRWLGPIGPYLPPILALALFLGLWSTVGLVREPVLWLAAGLFWLMRRTGFVTVTEKQVSKEVVSL